ncbi:MAG: BamA/TamA family outer membrane protein [Planctomycetia bacterium]|nr:BamA/TamA family outer membrane protein [Planctomycetia bacterium]
MTRLDAIGYMNLQRYIILMTIFCWMIVLPSQDQVFGEGEPEGSRTLLTPEDISGASLREMNGIEMMSRDFTESPTGQEVPQGSDDLWIPDMSLQSPSEAAGVSVSGEPTSASGSTGSPGPAVAMSTPASGQVPAAHTANTTNTANTLVASAAPAESATPGAAPTFHPGFQVINASDKAFVPPMPPLNEPPVYPKAGQTFVPGDNTFPALTPAPTAQATPNMAPAPTTPAPTPAPTAPADEWSGAAFSSTQEFAKESFASEAAKAAQAIQTQTQATGVIPTGPDGKPAWGQPFSKPGEQHTTVDTIVSAQDAARMNLSGYTIEDIRVSGLEMSINRFNQLIKTKIGQKFDQQVLEEDKRMLLQTKQFIDVTVSTTILPDRPNVLTVNFDLTPRRLMQYIKILGNTKMSKSDILEELGMKRGESRMDPYDVENGRLRIIELYKNKGYNEPHVEILWGDQPEDVGVVYLISEGVKQRVLNVEFVGNKLASSARLKSLIHCKPGVLYVIGGDFSRELLDEDVTKLLEYYRRLGYFDARVDREFVEGKGYTGLGKDNAWVSVRYIIDEGPRYKVRDFLFDGNRVLSNDKLAKELKVKKGSYYNYTDLEQDRIALKYAYQNLGYVLAEIEPKQVISDEPGFLDIRYEVTENNRYRVRDILVDYDGDEARTKSTVVLNMIDIHPSELIDGPKIRESERTLQRSGYFNDKPQDGILPTIKILPVKENAWKIGDDNVLTRVETGETSDSPADPDAGPSVASALGAPRLADMVKPLDRSQRSVPSEPSVAPGTAPAHAAPATTPTEAPRQQAQSDSIIRGQSRQIPTGFRTTTTAPATQSSVPGSVATVQPSIANSAYADTSMYNNASTAAMTYNGSTYAGQPAPALTPATNSVTGMAPPVTGATAYTQPGYAQPGYAQPGLTQPANAQQIAMNPYGQPGYAPGFNAAGAAGRDAVFPGTQQQELLHDQLLGSGNITDPNSLIYDADVIAQIKEGRTGMFQASIGVNSDYGLVGNVSLTERNFDIMRWPTSFTRWDGWNDAFRGGGQIFQVQASPGTEIQRYSVSWDVPYLLDTKNSFGITGLYGDRSYTEWFESRLGMELRLGRQWTNRFSTSLSGSLYQIKLSDPIVTYVPDLTDALGSHMQYTAGLNAVYDTRNHPFLPSQGYVVTGTGEMVFGDYQFPRFAVDARHYTTLRKRYDGSGRWVLGLRAAAGWSGKDAPIYERYYGGGTANLRGFEYREVTPRYLTTGVGIGGNFEFYSSAEMLVPISGGDEFQLAFFVDSGTVSRTIKDWDKYRVAPGFGLRLSIPMLGPAPLALDFAFPVSKSRDDVEQVFSFSVSGSR